MTFTRQELLESATIKLSNMSLSDPNYTLEFLKVSNNTELKLFILGGNISKQLVQEGYDKEDIDILFENFIDDLPLILNEADPNSRLERIGRAIDAINVDSVKKVSDKINKIPWGVKFAATYATMVAAAALMKKFGKCIKHCDPDIIKRVATRIPSFTQDNRENIYKNSCIIQCKIQYYISKKNQGKIQKWRKKKELYIKKINSKINDLNINHGESGKAKANFFKLALDKGFEIKAY